MMKDDDVQDLDGDLESVDDDDDDDDEFLDDDQISPGLVDLAKVYGVDTSKYDNENQVSQAIQASIAKLHSGETNVSSKKEEQIELAALKAAIDDDENVLDEKLKKFIIANANTSNENNKKITKMLEAKAKGSGANEKMQKQIEQLQQQLHVSDERYWYSVLDDWIAKDPGRRKFFGEGRIGSLDQDGRDARKRRVCYKRANKYAGRQKGKFTAESMFKKAYKSMASSRKKADDNAASSNDEGTPLARADAGGLKDTSASDKSAEALKRKSDNFANKLVSKRG